MIDCGTVRPSALAVLRLTTVFRRKLRRQIARLRAAQVDAVRFGGLLHDGAAITDGSDALLAPHPMHGVE
jgi:hypothetical protein